jgi:hypothetical protein
MARKTFTTRNKYCSDGLYLADDAGDCPCLGHLCGEVPVMVVDTE